MPATAELPRAAPTEQRLVLSALRWDDYRVLGEVLRDRPALRLTYDRGRLEIMTTSPEQEKYKKRLARLVEVLAEEYGLALETGGNMTFQREDLDRGLEGDDCFWIAHESAVRGRLDWDPARDPPPDLLLEVEVSRSLPDRMAICAALGVPELWCFDGDELKVFVLTPERQYRRVARSPTFPAVPPEGLVPYLLPNPALDYLGAVAAFRQWLRGLRDADREP